MECFLVSKWHVFSFKQKGEDWTNSWRAFHWISGKPGSTSASASRFICFFFLKREKKKFFVFQFLCFPRTSCHFWWQDFWSGERTVFSHQHFRT